MKKVVDERLVGLRRLLERALKMKKFRGWSPERFLEHAYQAGRRDLEPEPRVFNVFISHGCEPGEGKTSILLRAYLDAFAAYPGALIILARG